MAVLLAMLSAVFFMLRRMFLEREITMANKNLMVKALAGTGKTTTMIWSVGSVPRGIKLTDEQKAIRSWFTAQKIDRFRFMAFNKSIATELSKKVPGYCEAGTCHSFGLSIIRMNNAKGARVKVDSWKYRKIMDKLFGEPKKPADYQIRNAADSVINLARVHLLGRNENSTLVLDEHDLDTLMLTNDIDCSVGTGLLLDMVNKSLAVGSKDTQNLDFADMIWAPVFHKMKASKVGGLIVDECFPAGTKVFTAGGLVPIEYIAEHPEFDWQVLSSVDQGRTLRYSSVTSAYKTPVKTHLVKVCHEKGQIICTANHPFWVDGKGWIAAGLLTSGDTVFNLRTTNSGKSETLQPEMCWSVEKSEQRPRDGEVTSGENIQTYERSPQRNPESYGTKGCEEKSVFNPEGQKSQTSNTRGQWQGADRTSDVTVSGIGSSPSSLAMEPRVCCVEWTKRGAKERASLSLQDRHSLFIENDSDRSGWEITRNFETEEGRCEKRYATEKIRVVSVEIYEPTSNGECEAVCGDNNYVYTLSVEDGSYFADGLLVKNCQDLSKAQQELVMMQGDQIICVGDVNQAIYGFAGADAASMQCLEDTLADRGGVDVLPLTVTRRCGKEIVDLAKTIVPSYRAASTNPKGAVVQGSSDTLVDDLQGISKANSETTMVLCRTNAPLVGLAFQLLRKEVPVIIRGRDIGAGLIKLVEKMAEKSDKINNMIDNLMEYADQEAARINKRYKYGAEEKLVALEDKVDCIRVLASDCSGVTDLTNKLGKLFQDREGRKNTIMLSSVHRAKGLESDNVFIYKPELLPHPKLMEKANGSQEINLQYVAYTRAIHRLVLVTTKA